ncbi:MFS transporter [Rubrivivax sp. A210]|uniref:MFS transporter n=1 Tax=Rubrivivax sp. A210 TaxID=2772301 RepID=UPI00191AABA8|nr:MFS transporter [Rubrivivax sp. A210]CAD5374822.1 MFS transporter [Rubrivivax sp. A210]
MALPAALTPLKGPVFRGLWLASLVANLTMWMNDVAAAWLMTTLTTSPVMVALVQTAATLPVFLLGLPSGALADIVDRRRYFAATQLWVSVNALILAGLSLADALSAPLLLALTFGNGIALAMRWPVFSAIVPMVVERRELGAALALNGISMNLSRVVGPVLAGALIAGTGPAAVFVLNTLLGGVAFALILRWRHEPGTSALPGERFVGAMRAGLNFALQSPRLRVILLRIFLFFLQSTALMALLPLVARMLHGGGAGTFTLMLSCVGGGAVLAAFFFPRWRERFNRDQFVRIGTVVHAALSCLVVALPEIWIALPAMVLAGMAWISVANSLTVAAQVAMPNWVRARGMAIYQMALMGGSAAGSLLWGQVAEFAGVRNAIFAAAAFGIVVLVATRRLTVEGGTDPDFTPAATRAVPEPAYEIGPEEGPVMVTLEYQIDPARAAEFAQVMQRTRRARLRQGALSWGLFRDVAVPGRYVEYFVDENWLEHQRRLERFTAFDAGLREQRMAFHLGPEPPLLRRYVAEGDALPPGAGA